MIKQLSLILCVVYSLWGCTSQTTPYPKVELGAWSEQKGENLRALGQVWGFLKYYHPAVRQGQYDWDAQLFAVWDETVHAQSVAARDSALVRWIGSIGPFLVGSEWRLHAKEAIQLPDLAWIDSSGFSPELTANLHRVRLAYRSNKNHYVAPGNVGQASFDNELPYAEMSDPDAGFRILALFRYWNAIHYYFPYRTLTDRNWNAVLGEMLPLFARGAGRVSYEMAVRRLIASIDDSHSSTGWLTKTHDFFGRKRVDIKVRFAEDEAVVVGSYSGKVLATPLSVGDVVERIDGRPMAELVADRGRFIGASNRGTLLRDVVADLFRTQADSVRLECVSVSGERKSAVLASAYLQPDLQKAPLEQSYRELDGNVGYLHLGVLQTQEIPILYERFKTTRGLVLDLRNYPKGVWRALCAVLSNKEVSFARFSQPILAIPGLFLSLPSASVCKSGGEGYGGKVMVLVNEQTQSHAEYTAMALRAIGATLVGSPTAGADGNITKICLPGGISVWFTGLGVYYPDGGATQRVGLVPDVVVYPTPKGIAEGCDEVLERVLQLIQRDRWI